MGVHEALLTVGMIVGSLGSGVIYQSSGVNAVFLACAILLAAVLVAQVVLFLRR
jgi:predicted MFS family arabinose efflux permease